MPWDLVQCARVSTGLEPKFPVSQSFIASIKGHELSSDTTQDDIQLILNFAISYFMIIKNLNLSTTYYIFIYYFRYCMNI